MNENIVENVNQDAEKEKRKKRRKKLWVQFWILLIIFLVLGTGVYIYLGYKEESLQQLPITKNPTLKP